MTSLKVECEGCGNLYRPESWTELYGIASVWSLRNPGKTFKASVRGPKGEVLCPKCYPIELEKDMESNKNLVDNEPDFGPDVEVVIGDTSIPKMSYVSNYIRAIDFEIKSKNGPYEYDVFLEDLKSILREDRV